ncbi:FK506-binding protein 2 [Papilio xuthus]|uniref:FK506-binding protein 2 n=1 Tax=Papilio xuthus TaxID=66420 RepID=A0A194PSA4_PAPXU|nr:FK506-binding protein 2 [Papilio xuthus]
MRCVFVLLALAGATFAATEPEFKIDVVSVPEECTTKSKHGDMLTMHYTGTLENGHKFDARLNLFTFVTKDESNGKQISN